MALHDFGVTPEGAFYYVMELLDGLDLETLVRRFGPVPPERAIHLLIQACDSLAEAHATGLVHRDVKPANILACHWGLKWDFVKVLDFGLVKSAWSMGDDDHVTSEGTITGTPAYMAPEAALGGQAIDARVDLYGLGCVAYWLLTGERVFVGRTPVEVLLHHVKTPPLPPSERAGRQIPASLEALVLACLAKDPDERPRVRGVAGGAPGRVRDRGGLDARARARVVGHGPDWSGHEAAEGDQTRHVDHTVGSPRGARHVGPPGRVASRRDAPARYFLSLPLVELLDLLSVVEEPEEAVFDASDEPLSVLPPSCLGS